MHYYQFNIGDYIKHTAHLSNEEDLAYRRLLDLYYDTEQPIPNNIPLVSRRLRINPEIIQAVLNEFFCLSDDGFVNHRASCEIADYKSYLDKQRVNGSKGGRPKSSMNANKKTDGFTTANPDLTQTEPKITLNTNHKPITNNHIIITPDRSDDINKSIVLSKKIKTEYDHGDLIGIGIDETIARDFLIMRKAKKAKLTETAFAGIVREAEKANLTIQQALQICVERNWQSFKADWVRDKQSGQYITFYELATGQKPEF